MKHAILDGLRRRTADTEVPVLLALIAALIAIVVVGAVRSEWVPYVVVLLPMFLANQRLGPRYLPAFTALAFVVLAVLVVEEPPSDTQGAVRILVVVVIGGLILLASHRRVGLGVAGPRGEAMLVELRDRIIRQGRIEGVGRGWYAASTLRSAGGTAFAGDFLVADVHREPGLERLRLAVVDVSGKGIQAGTRSLQLSGAMGGLLEALPAADFLPAANRFLLRQEWEEGFATAAHLDLDLDSGELVVRSAGHPPAIVVRAGGRGWELLEPEGPALGLLAEASYDEQRTRLNEGDVLVVYTDGVVEHPGRDISSGIDALGARVRERLDAGRRIAEDVLLEGLGRRDDDRALLVVQRAANQHVRPADAEAGAGSPRDADQPPPPTTGSSWGVPARRGKRVRRV